jgi:hypothetical protein
MGTLSIPCASRRQRHRGEGRGPVFHVEHWLSFCLKEWSRAPVRGVRARLREVKFSFACQKRTRKAPAISTRWIHEKGATRPFQTPKELSKPKNASRFAKRIFCASSVYGSADGVMLSQSFTFCKGVKSAAKQQIGETRKSATATTAACGGYREELLGPRSAGHECRSRHEVDAGHRNPS